MKQVKSLLVLSVLAGGLCAASADKTVEASTLLFNVTIATNNQPVLIDVNDALPVGPVSFNTNVIQEVSVYSDGAGKIEGSGWVRIEYGVTKIDIDTNTVPATTNTSFVITSFSDYIVDLTGKLGQKSSFPTVQMNIKGQGYSTGASTNYDGSLNQVSKSAGASKLQIKFTSDATAIVIDPGNTNFLGDERYFVTGPLKGSVSPGIDSINSGKTIKVNETGRLEVDYEKLDELDLAVVAAGTKISAVSSGGEFVGGGSLKSGKYNVNLKGIGQMKGSNVKLSGTTGNQNVIITGVTNVVVSLGSADITGKVKGQKIDTTGTSTVINPFID